MRRLTLSLISTFLVWPLLGYAQMSSDPTPNTPEWQLTLDVIKSKTRSLIDRNAILMNDHDTLVASIQRVQIDQRDWKLKNEALRQLLKQSRGKSEQQRQIDALNGQIKAKENNIKSLQRTLTDIQRDADEESHKIQLRKLKAAEIELHIKLEASQARAIDKIDQRSAIENDDEYDQLRQKLQDERSEEDDLKAQLEEVKRASAAPPAATPDVDEGQIKALEATLESLGKQKEDLQNRLNVDNSGANTQRYLQLMTKKKELEEKVKSFETQLNQLKEPATFGLLDSKQKKQIIRQMAQIDTRNVQLRQKISDLKQDVILLRDQVSRLERKTQRAQVPKDNKK
jgi:chromosome segregation ATPase